MRRLFFEIISPMLLSVLVSGPIVSGLAASAQQPTQSSDAGQSSGSQSGQRGRRGFGGDFPAGARGTLGTVTEVAGDHYTIKAEAGEVYTVFYSANTRIMKQPAGGGRRGQGNGAGNGGGNGGGTRQRGAQSGALDDADNPPSERQAPQPLKPTDIKVGDIITAGGELDATKKTIGAIFIMQIDPERAKQMREMQANYGKTWLAGRITAIDGTRITIEGIVDHAAHAIEVDENTSFRQRRDSITMADIHTGQQLRAEGGVKGGVFLATTVVASNPQNRDQGPGQQPGQAPNPN
jgi:hypothetical protein